MWSIIRCMSSEIKFEKHDFDQENLGKSKAVKVTDLISKLNEEKKRERNSNIALSVAAVSAVTDFGIILSL